MRIVWTAIAVVVFLFLFTSAWVQANPGHIEYGVIRCDDCKALGATINAWRYANNSEVACKLPIDARVVILYQSGDYYRVKGYACTGYVRSEFIVIEP